MCLIVFSLFEREISEKTSSKKSSLILIANRDEFFERPTRSMQWNRGILSGIDEEAGGTWFGVSKDGKFGAITNYREASKQERPMKSRGLIITNYLKKKDISAKEYFNALDKEHYDGFSLLLSDKKGVHFFSNRCERHINLKPGVNVLGNYLLNTQTNKVKKATKDFSLFLARNHNYNQEKAFKFMRSDFMEGKEVEKGISEGKELPSRFIKSSEYGTRCTTYLSVDSSGLYRVAEQNYELDGKIGSKKQFEFRV